MSETPDPDSLTLTDPSHGLVWQLSVNLAKQTRRRNHSLDCVCLGSAYTWATSSEEKEQAGGDDLTALSVGQLDSPALTCCLSGIIW